MRYLKVLLAVIFFFLVMLFFVQNQTFLSQSMPLKFELMFLAPFETPAIPFYTLGLICFLLGGLATLGMLILDRLSMGSHIRAGRRRMRAMEKELARATAALETLKTEMDTTKAKEEAAENKLHEIAATTNNEALPTGEAK